MHSIRSHFRRAALCSSALLAAVALPAHASADLALKNTAIVGTLTSWGIAALTRAPIGACLFDGAPPSQDKRESEWGVRLQTGSDQELRMLSLGAERRECRLNAEAGWQLDVSPVFMASRWNSHGTVAGDRRAWDAALVPMLHWRTPVGGNLRLDLEFGIGPAYLSEPEIGNRHKSTNFQFSDHTGIGIGSADGHWRLAFGYRHVSNADIQKPNNKVDFKGVTLDWRP